MLWWHYLCSLDTTSIVALLWYMIVLEVPRYFLGGFFISLDSLWRESPPPGPARPTITVLLVGHNEANALPACVRGLAEQTIMRERARVQIVVVDDGSTDGMTRIARALRDEGLVDELLQTRMRCGKSAGVNLGLTACRGDIVVIIDIDTTLDRDAIERLLPYFDDPRVGAVGGDMGVANAASSLVTRHQEIEYLLSISLGRRVGDLLGTLPIVSGAFGAFRRHAVIGVGGQDAEVGEDADLTMKLRRAGWRIRFAPDARALTNVPETIPALIAQRLRWDRGIVTIWFRKFRGALNPLQSTFRLLDVASLLDVLVFQFLLTLAFPVYIFWLWFNYGALFLPVLSACLAVYLLMDVLALACAAVIATEVSTVMRLVAYLPCFVVIQIAVLAPVRLIAVLQELLLRSSYRDPYVPLRVMNQVERF